jgi:H+/Cl- antiporter ClcA
LGGAIFVLEVLLGTFAVRAVIPAIVTSVLGAVVARIGLGDEAQYAVPVFTVDANLVIWSIIAGPLFGVGAHCFIVWTTKARVHAPKNWRILPLCLANFVLIGVASIAYPQILGNGKGPAALSFDGHITLLLAATLLAIKLLITVSTLRSGAEGGLMTPGIAAGALLAILLGGLWSMAFPGVALGAFALVGGAGFLASSMKMPLSALVLVSEFTGVKQDFLVPMLFAIVGSVLASHYLAHRADRRAVFTTG